MDSKQLQLFQDLGLTEHEARVYLASLTLGPSTVLKIARLAEVKRTTVYSVVDALKQQGLMKVEVQGFKQLYSAEDPKTLERVLDRRKNQLHNQMPDLSALYNMSGGVNTLKYYEGLEAVKGVYESFLNVKPGEKYYIVSNFTDWRKADPEWFEGFLERRAKKNIKTKALFQSTPEARQHYTYQKNYSTELKLLPETTKLTTNFVVVPSFVLIHQLRPPITGIVIESPGAIKMFQEFFEVMWNAIPE